MTPEEMRTAAETALRDRGPMKAAKLAKELGLPNARSLSLALQWRCQKFVNRNGKWQLMSN